MFLDVWHGCMTRAQLHPSLAPISFDNASLCAQVPQGLQGSQAQYVRVPLAESSLVKVRQSKSHI